MLYCIELDLGADGVELGGQRCALGILAGIGEAGDDDGRQDAQNNDDNQYFDERERLGSAESFNHTHTLFKRTSQITAIWGGYNSSASRKIGQGAESGVENVKM